MRMLKQQWANSLIAKVYVDDLTLIMRGLAGAVVDGLADVLNFVIQHLQDTF